MSKNNTAQTLADERGNQRHELKQSISVIDTMSETNIGQLANVTLEGLMIVCTQPIENNRIYQIELQLAEPINGQSSVELAIDCLWVKPSGTQEQNMYWAGCSIIDATDTDLEIIEQLISTHSH